MATHHFTGTALIYAAPDLPDQWIGVCPEFGVVTQGGSIRDALEMVWEAAEMVIVDDLEQGRDPGWRRSLTDAHDWDLLGRIWATGKAIELTDETVKRRDLVVAAPMHMSFDGFTRTLRQDFPYPVAMDTALDALRG